MLDVCCVLSGAGNNSRGSCWGTVDCPLVFFVLCIPTSFCWRRGLRGWICFSREYTWQTRKYSLTSYFYAAHLSRSLVFFMKLTTPNRGWGWLAESGFRRGALCWHEGRHVPGCAFVLARLSCAVVVVVVVLDVGLVFFEGVGGWGPPKSGHF